MQETLFRGAVITDHRVIASPARVRPPKRKNPESGAIHKALYSPRESHPDASAVSSRRGRPDARRARSTPCCRCWYRLTKRIPAISTPHSRSAPKFLEIGFEWGNHRADCRGTSAKRLHRYRGAYAQGRSAPDRSKTADQHPHYPARRRMHMIPALSLTKIMCSFRIPGRRNVITKPSLATAFTYCSRQARPGGLVATDWEDYATRSCRSCRSNVVDERHTGFAPLNTARLPNSNRADLGRPRRLGHDLPDQADGGPSRALR
jgi:hypothetical protein